MTPRPKYSRGCSRCRRMKVKCDEKSPQCQRCVRAGETCSGYPEMSKFLSMNGEFEPAQSPARLYPASQHEPSKDGRSKNCSPQQTSTLVSVRPSMEWEQNSEAYFVTNFALHSQSANGYLAFLPDILLYKKDTNCLKHSFKAAALMSFANISKIPDVMIKARQAYGRALISISDTMGRGASEDFTSIITAVLLIQMFEQLDGSDMKPGVHELALFHLLRNYDRPRQLTLPERRLLFSVGTRIMTAELANQVTLPLSGVFTGQCLDKNERVAMWHLVGRAVRVHRSIELLLQHERQQHNYQPPLHDLIETIQHAATAEAELRYWRAHLGDDELYKSIVLSIEQSHEYRGLANYKVNFFHDIQTGSAWLVYWSGHLRLLRSMLDGLELGGRYFPEHDWGSLSLPNPTSLETAILCVANEICSSIPFLIGNIRPDGSPSVAVEGKALGGFFALFGLKAIAAIQFLPEDQRQWISDTLITIGHGWGIGQALTFRQELVEQRLI